MDLDLEEEDRQASEEHKEVWNDEGIMGLFVVPINFVHIYGVLGDLGFVSDDY